MELDKYLYYEDEWTRIYCGDCREILPLLESVDIVLTDPPFGVRSDLEWDAKDEHEFAAFTMQWLGQVASLTSRLMVFCNDGSLIRKLAEMVYPRVRQLIWHKPLGSQYAGAQEAKRWFSYEVVLDCYTLDGWEVCQPKMLDVGAAIKKAREAKGLSRGAIDMVVRGKKTGLCYRWEEGACLPTPEQVRQLKDLLEINGDFDAVLQASYDTKVQGAEKCDVLPYRTITNPDHPCEKPVGLLCDLLSLKERGVMLDPFCGVGSSLVAAKRQGFKSIGIEQDEKYCRIAVDRLRQGVLALSG